MEEYLKDFAEVSLEKVEKLTPAALLNWVYENFKNDEIRFSTSLGAEDQVVTDLLFKDDRSPVIFTLDTGRLPYETYSVLEETVDRYGNIDIFFPEDLAVEQMVRKGGINLFYKDIESRKECCRIRKIEPLKRGLSGAKVWITGLRRDQSVTREELKVISYDPGFNLIKINPLVNWSEEDVWNYIKNNDVPYNILHDRGYPSIGCAPCTREIKPGEDIRAGRWWWETPEKKECGLHIVDGKLVRRKK